MRIGRTKARLISELTIDADVAMATHKITGMGNPTAAQDAATRAYVLAQKALCLLLAGGTMTGPINLGGSRVRNQGAPTAQNDGLRYGQAEIRNAEIKSNADIAISKLVDDYLPEVLLTAQGDLLTRSDTVPKKLTLGTAGHYLKAGADEPEWAALAAADLPTHGASEHTDVTRELFISANEGYIYAGTPMSFGCYPAVEGALDGNEPNAYFILRVPSDFVSFTSVKVVWSSLPASGNMYWQITANYAASGQAYTTHGDTPSLGATATGGANILNVQEPTNPLTLTGLAKGDYLGLQFYRGGSMASDTLDDEVKLYGILFTYTAEQ